MPNKQAETQFVSFIRGEKLSKFITIKNDGSIHVGSEDDEIDHDHGGCNNPDGDDDYCNCCNGDCECEPNTPEFGREIVVTFKYNEWNTLNLICSKLNELGCRVNKTCGLHVHFDCRHLKYNQVITLAKRVALVVPALKQMLPSSRQNNQFCEQNINLGRGGGRYAFVNVKSYHKHSTLEIRGHSGTTDAIKIIQWIKLLRIIMQKRNTTMIETVKNLVQKMPFEADTAKYMVERAKKFSKVKDTSLDDVEQDNAILEVA
jgi:hypothetical protein